ncbi:MULTISPECIES: DUF1648 domain-containing protein [unclassified Streptomyces]|uniref:DUF1648 domain-containing protein n=1 Tax=unclassified Streptomyces TaxID=2593676 RepID=UPI00070235C5|nr:MULTISPECIES: DUF1648 domain-containing protein [unclassified Streptomyces]KQX49600.1 hypothetical protein ASD33_17920 [Streptomyces sp. Root1304]KRA79220.1 hypothetical protein ASE09_22440 [Streptomyces sp. Root66D1]
MNRSTPRLRALAALPFVLALTVYVLLLVLRHDRLPDTLATHFGLDGRPDGFTGRTAFAVVGVALLLTLGAGWTALVRHASLWGAWATAGFAGALLVLVVRDNLDVTDPAQVSSPLLNLALAAATAAVLGIVGWGLTQLVPEGAPPAARDGAPDGPRLPLGASEVAGWSHATASGPLTVLGVLVLAAVPVGLLLAPWPGALLALLGLVIGVPGLALARVRVTVDRRGVTVRPSLVPRPRVRVPLGEVAGASVRELDTAAVLGEFGGWGYRVRAHRTGVIVRTGETLVVRRDSGREFAVTVPDAGTAAALLNTLVERHGKV